MRSLSVGPGPNNSLTAAVCGKPDPPQTFIELPNRLTSLNVVLKRIVDSFRPTVLFEAGKDRDDVLCRSFHRTCWLLPKEERVGFRIPLRPNLKRSRRPVVLFQVELRFEPLSRAMIQRYSPGAHRRSSERARD